MAEGRVAVPSILRRRDILKLGALLVDPALPWAANRARVAKRVIVAGAGIAGLACGYELAKRGHDVVIFEASDRTGGHVRTLRGRFADGLYADVGAEHFTSPGYELLRGYAKEFGLAILAYPHRENVLTVVNGRMVSEAQAQAAAKSGLNDREVQYIERNPFEDLSTLYFARYFDRFRDEYQPFGIGLDHLDDISVRDFLRREGASQACVREFGSGDSALHVIWKAAILRMRGVPSEPHNLFRLKGGNQMLPDEFARRLGNRIRKNTPVTAIRWDDTGVAVTYRDGGREKPMDGDYLVCAMDAIMLRQIAVSPAWPPGKRYAIENMPYTVETRPVFQSGTKFWQRDGYSGNMDFGSPLLGPLWPMAEEVPTERGLLIGTAQAGVKVSEALGVFRHYYPGKSEDIDASLCVDWSRDQWAMGCEARNYAPGQLHKFWPATIEPVGRVWFAGAYCDNQSWGMEAATRSANRVARAIHSA